MCTCVTHAWDIVHHAPKRIMHTSCIPRGVPIVAVTRVPRDASRRERHACACAPHHESTLGNSARYVACPRLVLLQGFPSVGHLSARVVLCRVVWPRAGDKVGGLWNAVGLEVYLLVVVFA